MSPHIRCGSGILTLGGSNNTVGVGGSLILQGAASNNKISMGTGKEIHIKTDDDDETGSLTDTDDGTIILRGSVGAAGASLSGGVLTIQLGDGNVATIDNIASGSQIEYVDDNTHVVTWYTLQDTGLNNNAAPLQAVLHTAQSTGQLVSAMAGYNADAGHANTMSASQSSNDVMFQQTLVAA